MALGEGRRTIAGAARRGLVGRARAAAPGRRGDAGRAPGQARGRAGRCPPASSARASSGPSGEQPTARLADASRRPSGAGRARSDLAGLAVPADRRLRLPLGLPHRRAGRLRRLDRVDVPAALRLAVGVRRDARPRRRQLARRPLRRLRAGRAALHPGHEHDRDDLDDAAGLAARGRRADDRRLARQRARLEPHAPADRLRRRPPARAHDRVHPGPGAGRDRLRADARLRRHAGELERSCDDRRATGACAIDATDGRRPPFRLFSDIRMGIEGNRAHGRHTMAEGEKRFCALSWTEGLRRAAHRRAGRGAPRAHRATSGAPGWPKAPTPTTPGAFTCSARRSC